MVNRKDRLTDKDYKIISDQASNLDNYQHHNTIEISQQQTLTVQDFLKIENDLYGLTLKSDQADEMIIAFHCPTPNGTTISSLQDVQTAAQSLLKTDLSYPIENKTLAGKENHVFFKGNDYVKNISSSHPKVSIKLTGQALAGAVCAFIATQQPSVKKAVTFDSPNILNSLPPSVQHKANRGEFTNVLTEFINPANHVGLLNRASNSIGNVKYTVPPKDNSTISATKRYHPKQLETFLKSAFASMNIDWNESIDTNTFLALVSGDLKVNGYSFHPSGSTRLLDEQLDHNTDFTSMLLGEIYAGRADARKGLEIVIKSHLLKNTSYDLQEIIEHEVHSIFEKIDSIDESVKTAVNHVKQVHKGLVGFGHYDLLSAADVDSLLEELRQEQTYHAFHSHDKQLNALQTLKDYGQELSTLSRHLYTMGNDYAKADKRMAAQIGIH
ncbi:hydrolase [Bacillus sp. NPDC077027]|uniref:hydrolase n=1 Tax=Bacillus sp. NPDC077027 TaxID=3390548 RepID=UPI003CFE8585